MLYKSIDDDEIFSFGQSIGLSELTGFMNSIGKNGSGSFNAWIYNPQYLEVYTDLGINKLHFLQVQVVEKEAELIHQIVVKTIDLKSPKNQSTWVSKRKETTDYHAIESMLKEALEVNTRYFK